MLSVDLNIHYSISTPETFDIVSTTVDIGSRKNLAQISRMLTQITSGSEFSENHLAYLPVNDYVRKTITSITSWLLEGLCLFRLFCSLQLTSSQSRMCPMPKPSSMPTSSLTQRSNPDPSGSLPTKCTLCIGSYLSTSLNWYDFWISLQTWWLTGKCQASTKDDTLRVILTELDGVPNVGSDELNEARDTAIELQLSNRFARVKGKSLLRFDIPHLFSFVRSPSR